MNVDATALRLIDLLYQGLEDPAAFDSFTESLTVALNAAGTGLSLELVPSKHSTPTSIFGTEQHYVKLYEEYYHFINVYTSESAHLYKPGAVLSTEETCPDRVLLASEFYNDWLQPQKLLHAVGAIVHLSPRQTSMVTVYPVPHSNAFDHLAATTLLAALIPHLQRVFRMAAQNGAAEVGKRALDHVHAGVVVVGAARNVLLMNEIAEGIIARSDGLSYRGGVIHAMQPQDDVKLGLAIHSVCATEKPSADRSQKISTSFAIARRLNSHPYLLTVDRFFGKPAGIVPIAAIIYVSDPEEAPQIPERALAQLYALTTAEARLANLLLQGSDLTDACGLLAIRRNTGRAHLRSIFDKLGVRSQSQVVALLARNLASASRQRIEQG